MDERVGHSSEEVSDERFGQSNEEVLVERLEQSSKGREGWRVQ